MFGRIVSVGIFLSIALGAIIQGTYRIVEISDADHWQDISATVDSINVSGSDDDNFKPVIYYQYEISGKSYTGNRLSLARSMSYDTRGSALQAAEEYLKPDDMGKVDIFYDPSNPQESTIIKGEPDDEYYLIGIGLFFLFIAYKSYRDKKK